MGLEAGRLRRQLQHTLTWGILSPGQQFGRTNPAGRAGLSWGVGGDEGGGGGNSWGLSQGVQRRSHEW